MEAGLKKAFDFYKWAAESVPAYKKFLTKSGVDVDSIKEPEDFHKLPSVDKKNYLRKYSFIDLFPDKQIPAMISVSSGSSGVPFYWPRDDELELRGSDSHEDIFRDIFEIGQKRTLAVICFSMGTWIAGTFTATCCRNLRRHGLNVTVITPGIEREDALAALKNLAPAFEQVVLIGYPPFLMDLVSEARFRKISLKKFKLNLLFAGENFTEKWREAILRQAGIKDSLKGSVNIYGTADAAMLGHETPLTVFIRKMALKNKKFREAFFGDVKFIPTLAQYHPENVFFELIDGELVFTTHTGIPLIRYNIRDRGILHTFEQAKEILEKFGYAEQAKEFLDRWQLPMVVLCGRNDVAVTFYALNVYPENIKAGLEDKTIINSVSGKFIASTKYVHDNKDQKFILQIELARRVEPSKALAELVRKAIVDNLIKLNAEYRKLHRSIGRRALPQIKLMPFGDPRFQVRGSKHRWIKKN